MERGVAQRNEWSCVWLAAVLTVVGVNTTAAQVIESQAIPARPFGVAAVSFTVTENPAGSVPDFFITERNGRAYYPVFTAGRLARLLGGSNEPATGATRTVFFLFTGTDPLRLTLHTPAPQSVELRPQPLVQRNFDRLLTRWWREFHTATDELAEQGGYAPLLQTYLTGMLGQRLNLRPPLVSRLRQETKSPLGRTFDLLLATESQQLETLRRTMSGPRRREPADQPLPADVAWTPLALAPNAGVAIEPIARHVPEECFYVRFGSFENYQWLEDLTTSYGGDISRMVTARGQDAQLTGRVRRQLSLPDSVLAKLFGGQLIADVALIGRDLYLQEGAAVGVLFHARTSLGLSASLRQHRYAAMLAEAPAGATLENVSIAGREVSFLSTPDNQLRSYYAIDGDFHLVTTSRQIAQRFLELGRGQGALSDSAEFQFARVAMPLDRNDTIFAYFSTAFFRGLAGPHYQIELQRRLQALADLQLVRLARLAATNEGARSESIEDLVAGGLLPAGFGRGSDGSGPILESRRVIDSLRGVQGSFTPIPDIELIGASRSEVADFEERARYFASQWRQLDPLMVGIQRKAVPGEPLERLTIDANISPIAEEKYGRILSVLGPPVTQRVASREGEVISMQAFVTGGQLSNAVPPHLLFLGVRDSLPAMNWTSRGLWQTLQLLRTTPGYLGAWPKPGFVDWLPLQRTAPAADGYSRLLFDVWRWQGNGFSLLSFDRNVLDATIPQLRIEDTDQPAQIRAHVGDLSQSQLRDWVNGMYFQRARETSIGNVRLFQALAQQLRMPAEKAMAVSQELLHTSFVCPLGGTYECAPSVHGRMIWQSTAWPSSAPLAMPPDYQAPLLKWFRGLDLSLTRSKGQVQLHAEVDMRRESPIPAINNPLFDLFKKG